MPGRALLALGAGAVLMRVAVIAWTPESIPFADMVDYDVRAKAMLQGRPLPDSFRGPGYPAWLALLYALPIGEILAARLGNAVLAAATAMVTAILASEVAGRRTAIAAGAAVALYPASVLSSVYLMPEGLYGLLIVLTLLAARRRTPAGAVVTGALAGLAALTRSLGSGLVPAVAAGDLVTGWRERRWRPALARTAILVAVCGLTLTPWLRHTMRVSGGVMLDSSTAYNVLLGANPRARERLQIEDGDWVRATYLAGAVDEADRNRRSWSAAGNWIRSNPAAWLRLIPSKMSYLWGLEGREHAWAYSQSYLGRHRVATVRLWGIALLVCLPPLALAALVGLFRPRPPATVVRIAALLVVVTAMHGLSFSETRYHLPLIPLLAILAARGIAGRPAMTAPRWAMAAMVAAGLVLGWWHQLPELLERYAMLTTPDGWRLMLTF